MSKIEQSWIVQTKRYFRFQETPLNYLMQKTKKISDTKYSGCKPFVFNFTSVSIIRNKCHKRSHAFISIPPIQAFYDRTFFLTCRKSAYHYLQQNFVLLESCILIQRILYRIPWHKCFIEFVILNSKTPIIHFNKKPNLYMSVLEMEYKITRA